MSLTNLKWFRNFNIYSIRMKLVASSLVISLLPLLMITLYQLYTFEDARMIDIEKEETNIAITNANLISTAINRDILTLSNIVKDRSEKLSSNTQETMDVLHILHAITPTVESIAISDQNGIAIDVNGKVQNIADTAYFKQVQETRQPTVSDLFLNKATEQYSFAIAVPILDANQSFRGVVYQIYNQSFLQEKLSEVKVGKTGFGYLLATDGTFVSHPEPSLIGQNLKDKADAKNWALFAENVFVRESGMIINSDTSGNERIAAYKRIPSTNWVTIITAPAVEVFGQIEDTAVTSLLLILIACLAVILLSLFLSKSMTAPILSAIDFVTQISKGDFTLTYQGKRNKDEIGNLIHSIQNMAAHLNDTIIKISSMANHVSNSSLALRSAVHASLGNANLVNSSIEDVTKGTELQTRSAQETSASMNEMATGIQKIAESSSQIAETALVVSQETKNGEDRMIGTKSQMSILSSTIYETSESIKQLEDYSNNIEQIIDVIQQIAGQTQLLSLNASIEAARAGEHGRGFAVVANEIQKLAVQSKSSTEKISMFITQIQDSTGRAVSSMEQGVIEVENGISSIDQLNESFSMIFEAVNRVSSQIQEESATSEQISAGTQEVAASMEEIVQISKQSSVKLQDMQVSTQEQLLKLNEMNDAAVVLQELSSELLGLIQQFKTSDSSKGFFR